MPAPRSTATRGSAATGVVIDQSEVTPIPSSFMNDVVGIIRSMEEMQVSLAIFRLLHGGGGFDLPLAEKQILRDRSLRAALRVEGSPRAPDTGISKGLELAITRGTLIRLVSAQGRKRAVFYYLNTVENRTNTSLMEVGQLAPPRDLWPDDQPPQVTIDRPNAFRLYEQNIGPLTPLIADQISRAIEDYPDDWIEDALEEAVSYNRRSWRYVMKILESWQASGRQSDNS